jgi:hypothetical protein
MLKDEQGIWLTTGEAAERRGLSDSRIRVLRLAGIFPSARQIGHIWVLLQSEVDAYERKPSGYPAGRPRQKSED